MSRYDPEQISRAVFHARDLVEAGRHDEVPELLSNMILNAVTPADDAQDGTGPAWVSEMVEPWRKRMTTREHVIPSPWPRFNQDFSGGGFGAPRVYVVGAPTGAGKSVATVQIVSHAAECGYPALAFTAEMDRLEIMDRVVARKARIPLDHIEARDLSDMDWRRYDRARTWFEELPLIVDDTAPMSIEHVEAETRRRVRDDGVRMISVDYVQLLQAGSGRVSREQEVAHLSRRLKALVMELNLTAIVVAQLNTDGRARESKQIENDANALLILSRPDEEGAESMFVDVTLPKNRNGRKGSFRLLFNGVMADLEPNDPVVMDALRDGAA